MGFYDRSDRTRKRDSHLLTGLISGLVGGVLVLTLSPCSPRPVSFPGIHPLDPAPLPMRERRRYRR